MTDKAEHVRFLRWVKINFVQVGDMWTKIYPYNRNRQYSDNELFDLYSDWLNKYKINP